MINGAAGALRNMAPDRESLRVVEDWDGRKRHDLEICHARRTMGRAAVLDRGAGSVSGRGDGDRQVGPARRDDRHSRRALPAVTAAADELQHHLRKASGAILDVVKESTAPKQGAKLFFGATRAAAQHGLKIGSDTANAFRIKLVGGSLFILGDDSDGPVFGLQQSNYTRVGTLFGAYEFLEKSLGVRWLWPGELGEVIPPANDLSLSVERWDQTGQPVFIHARWRDAGAATAAPEGWSSPAARAKYLRELSRWLRRHRFAMGVNMDMAHSFTHWWDRFAADHPEYFNLLPDGTRRSDPTYYGMGPRRWSRCRWASRACGGRRSRIGWPIVRRRRRTSTPRRTTPTAVASARNASPWTSQTRRPRHRSITAWPSPVGGWRRRIRTGPRPWVRCPTAMPATIWPCSGRRKNMIRGRS